MDRREWCRRVLPALGAPFALGGLTGCVDLLVPTKRKLTRTTLQAGPWSGVFDTPDPFDASSDTLRDATNIDIPDPENKSGAYARNGFGLGNNGATVTTSFGPLYAQSIHTHTALDGSTLNFSIVAGKLLRSSAVSQTVMTITDVTPAGVSINSGLGPISITSLLDTIIVNDGVSRPWIGTNLTASPITGTYIDYDGTGVAWTAYGAPAVFQGSVFFILNSVGGVSRRQDVSWSEPGDASIGWQQATFDNNWTLSQHATGPLFALTATNLALYYFRANSIGAIQGEVGPNLASTATNDAVATGIGCTAWRTIQQYGNAIFFADARGRVHRYVPGDIPTPLWQQMRGIVQQHGGNDDDQLGLYASSVLDPMLNRYLVTLWRADVAAATTVMPSTIYSFTADTGKYMGRWTIADSGSGGVGIGAMGLLNGIDNNEPTTVILGESVVGSQSLGFLWYMRVRGWPFPDPNQWLDNVQRPYVTCRTNPLGEAEDITYAVDRVAVITGNPAPCQITMQTPNTSNTVVGTPVANGASNDGTYRLVAGADRVQGRGPSVIVSPQSNDPTLGQWSLQRIDLVAVPSTAGPEDL